MMNTISYMLVYHPNLDLGQKAVRGGVDLIQPVNKKALYLP